MDITLKNFKIWTDKKFNFNSKGDITLISGKSGNGKSSILQAIAFVLYGTGGSKIISHGHKSCSVELKWGDMLIKRTKGPNRLILYVVTKKYEDAAAQGIIDNTFGENFNTISYISQKGSKSFINLSPKDKLLFLEDICFDSSLPVIKTKVLLSIKTEKNNIGRLEGELSSIKTFIQDLTKPSSINILKHSEDVMFYINKQKKLKIELLKLSKFMRDKMNEKCRVVEMYNKNVANKTKINEYEYEISRIVDKDEKELKSNLIDVLNIMKHFGLLDSVKSLVIKLKKYVSIEDIRETNRVLELNKKIKTMEGNIITKERRDNIKANVLLLVTEVDNLKRLLKVTTVESIKSDINILKADSKKYNSKKIKYEEDIKVLNIKISNLKKRKCPKCKAVLIIEDDCLHMHKNQSLFEAEKGIVSSKYVNDISISNRKILICDKKIDDIKSKLNELVYLEGLNVDVNSDKKLNDLRLLLKDGVDIERLNKLKLCLKREDNVHIINMTTEIETIKRNIQYDLIEDNNMIDLDKTKRQLESNINNIIKDQQLKKRLKLKIKDVKSRLKECDEWCDDIFTDIESKSNIVNSELSKTLKIIEDINNWKKWKKDYDLYKKWNDKLLICSKDLSIVSKRYTALLKMKNIILKAESITLINYINSINLGLEKYLHIFFYENPIVVHLSSFKENKKGTVKHQVNIKTIYKGVETDLTCLSGGEYDRVQLAINLALSDMHNTPILLLDESLSSLDEVTCSKVLAGIKCKSRITIVVAHQVVKGNFDNVVCV
jgi:ABC-type lipoprotein export system ATPase subunit